MTIKRNLLLFSLLILSFINCMLFAQTPPLQNEFYTKNTKLNFTEINIRNTIDSIWSNYYSHDLNTDGTINASVANQLSWRGSVAVMMFTHAYEVLGDLKYLHYAEQAYMVANSQWSDDLAWAANSAFEILRNLQNAPTSYKSLRSKEYYAKDINDIYHSITTPIGNSIPGTTKPYDTFAITYKSPQMSNEEYTTEYSTIMWSTNPTWGLNDPQFNTCSLGQSIVLSYQMSQNEFFVSQNPSTHASEWLKTEVDNLMNYETGMIYDHVKLYKDSSRNDNYTFRSLDKREFTYNTATVLAALGLQDDLNQSTKLNLDNKVQLYQNIFNRIVSQFTKNNTLTEFNTNPEFYPGETYGGDHAAFKGVFMHFLPYFYFSKTMQNINHQDLQTQFKNLINSSSNAAWEQLKNNHHTASYDWTVFNQAQTNCITTISAAESLITAWQFK